MTPVRYAFGLVGYPLSHSFSPRLHAAALRFCGLQGEYRLIPIESSNHPETVLQNVLDEVRNGEISGLNVTIPYKQTVLPLLDRLTLTAQRVKAVNTIYYREGRLVGDNTDVAGFWADLSNNFPSLVHQETEADRVHMPEIAFSKTALVLGAGGSARAVVYALGQAGWTVVVAARRKEQAQKLAADFSLESSRVNGLKLSHAALQDMITRPNISLIINTTPLGMRSYQQLSPWPDKLAFPPNARIYDLVYNPQQTIFLQQARLAGLEAVNGLGMLLEQARLSFELWTGIRPPRETLQAALKDSEKI